MLVTTAPYGNAGTLALATKDGDVLELDSTG